jgi:hypothetical protein
METKNCLLVIGIESLILMIYVVISNHDEVWKPYTDWGVGGLSKYLVLIGYLPILGATHRLPSGNMFHAYLRCLYSELLQIVNLSCDSYFPLPTITRKQLGVT